MGGHALDLYWIPLGAGGHCIALNGRLYEAGLSLWQRRGRCDLYHSALKATTAEGVYAIEVAPEMTGAAGVAQGPVGSRLLGWSPLFRYQVRCALGGAVPDIAEAVDSPRRLSTEPAVVGALVAAVNRVPRLVWGRDEVGAGDMWNSNSVISWLLSTVGLDAATITPPAGGRAPGWRAGVRAATRGVSTGAPSGTGKAQVQS